jgi:hypothetical protein
LLKQLKPGETFLELLDRFDMDVVYLDEECIQGIELQQVFAGKKLDPTDHVSTGRDAPGWKRIDGGNDVGYRWRLYRRVR